MSQTEIISPALKAGKKEWVGLAILALPTLLVSMDATVTYLALPSISASLKPTSSELLWITDIYIFIEGGLLITMGTLGDRIGRKKLLLYGAIAFSIASVFASFAQTPGMLIVARGLLGIAGATLLPSTVSIIRSMFHNDHERSVAMGIWTTCFSTGTLLGPLVGGILLDQFWWGSVFLIAVPLMIIFMILGPIFLTEYRSAEKEKFDLPSTFLLTFGILPVIYSIKQISETGRISLQSTIVAITGVLILFAFFKRQRSIPNPLIDLGLFRYRPFNATLLALMFALFCWSGLYLFVAQHLQLVFGFDPARAGLWTVPAAALGMISCLSAPWLARWLGKNRAMIIGLTTVTAGILMLALISHHNELGVIIAGSLLLTAGCSITVTLGVDKVISSVPPDRAGAGAGIYETSTTFGSALGVAILGSIGAAVYRGQMLRDVPALYTERSGNTLGEAMDLAKELKNEAGALISGNAISAFTHALSFTALIALAGMVLVIFVVRRIFVTETRGGFR